MENWGDVLESPVFKYRPLEPNSIRLIEVLPESTRSDIRCTLQHHRLNVENEEEQAIASYASGDQFSYVDKEKSWVALSYCWGDPQPVANITINGGQLGVARNLLDFFHALVRSPRGGTFYWIDAICINQQDLRERSAQVQDMWRVYAGADSVLSWLGPLDHYTVDAFTVLDKSLREAERRPRGRRKGSAATAVSDMTPRSVIDAARTILRAEYFSRVWVVPELLNGKTIFLMSGPLVLSWEAVQIHREVAEEDSLCAQKYVEQLNGSHMGMIDPGGEIPLRDIFDAVSEKACADPRDRLFSLIAYPAMRRRVSTGRLRSDYSMLPEEVCVMALAFYDKVSVEGKPHDYPAVLLGKLNDGVVQTTCNMLGIANPFHFQEWLRAHVRLDSIRTASGELLDCTGAILQDLLGDAVLLHKPDNWRELYKAHRTQTFLLRGVHPVPEDNVSSAGSQLLTTWSDGRSRAALQHTMSCRSLNESTPDSDAVRQESRSRETTLTLGVDPWAETMGGSEEELLLPGTTLGYYHDLECLQCYWKLSFEYSPSTGMPRFWCSNCHGSYESFLR